MSDPQEALDLDLLRKDERFVRALAARLVQDQHDAEDIVQQTWLTALERRPSRAQSLRPWLAAVVRNLASRLRRGERRRRLREEVFARPERAPATEELVRRVELRRLVAEAVLSLEEPYRETVLLRFLEELPPRDIAARQGVPVGTVKTRLHRALCRVRDRLDRHLGGDAHSSSLALLWLLEPSKSRAATSAARTTARSVMPLAGIAVAMLTGIALLGRLAIETGPTESPKAPAPEPIAVASGHEAHRLPEEIEPSRSVASGGSSLPSSLPGIAGPARVTLSEPGGGSVTTRDEVEGRGLGAGGTGSLTIEIDAWPWSGFEHLRMRVSIDAWEGGRPVLRRGFLGRDGRFVFPELPPRTYTVGATVEGANLDDQEAALSEGQDRVVRFRRREARLFGTISPFSEDLGLRRIALGAGGTPANEGLAFLTSEGYEIWGLAKGRHRLRVTGKSSFPWETVITMHDDEQRFDLELPRGRIEGRIIAPDFRARGDVPIMVLPWGVSPSCGNRGALPSPDSEGRFVVEHVPAGRYTVLALGEGRRRLEAEAFLAEGARVEVELADLEGVGSVSGQLSGLPRFLRHGEQLASLSIAAFRLDEPGYDFGVGRSGYVDPKSLRYRIEELPAGTYGLLVDDSSKRVARTWTPGVVVHEGEEASADIPILTGREVLIDIDTDERMPALARWSVVMHDGTPIPFFVWVGSGPYGWYAGEKPFRLPLGRYELRVDFGDERRCASFDLGAGDDVRVVTVEQ